MKFAKVLAGSLLAAGMFTNAHTFAAPHTWHSVKAAEGTWTGKLQMINEGGSFVTRANSALTSFTITPTHTQEYGFQFDAGDDFDVAYTLTLTEVKKTATPQFVSKTCVYVITAKGPAQPDIRASNYNGAKCDWSMVTGVGEDFRVG